MDVRVIIIYSDKLDAITVDGIKLEGIYAIQDKEISEWFNPSDVSDGWEGMINEIQKMIDDDNAQLYFEFQGPKENKDIFEQTIAESGFGKSPEAQFKTAEYYFNHYLGADNGVSCDGEDSISKAIDYYKKAAEAGYLKAQYRLYEIFSTDKYVEKDYDLAMGLLEKAASAGDVDAQVKLGNLFALEENENYYKLKNDAENTNKAYEWYKKAADQGDARAQNCIGDFYYYGFLGEKDYSKAYEWYKKAADQGDARGQYRIGHLYYKGYIGEIDYSKAYEWFEKAAAQEYPSAQYMIGWEYYGHLSYSKAYEWYKKAADQGDADAQYRLGDMYYKGDLGEPDYEKAYEWYKKAAEQGDKAAQCNINRYYDEEYPWGE